MQNSLGIPAHLVPDTALYTGFIPQSIPYYGVLTTPDTGEIVVENQKSLGVKLCTQQTMSNSFLQKEKDFYKGK